MGYLCFNIEYLVNIILLDINGLYDFSLFIAFTVVSLGIIIAAIM